MAMYHKLTAVQARLNKHIHPDSGSRHSPDKRTNATIRHDRFVRGVVTFFRKNPWLNDEIIRYIEQSAQHIGARQFAQVGSLFESQLELVVNNSFYPPEDKLFHTAAYCIEGYLKEHLPSQASVTIEFYDKKSGRPYEAISLGKGFHIIRAFLPSSANGRLKAVISEGDARYHIEFFFRKMDEDYKLVITPVHYETVPYLAEESTATIHKNRDGNMLRQPPWRRNNHGYFKPL